VTAGGQTGTRLVALLDRDILSPTKHFLLNSDSMPTVISIRPHYPTDTTTNNNNSNKTREIYQSSNPILFILDAREPSFLCDTRKVKMFENTSVPSTVFIDLVWSWRRAVADSCLSLCIVP
jgi:hypothetical protein